MNPSDLKLDTVIRLTKEIENPSPDRRIKDDWTKAPTFKPGRYIVQGEWISEKTGTIPVITLEGDRFRNLHRIGPRSPTWEAFVAASEPAEESLCSVLEIGGADNLVWELLDLWVRHGKLTLADVKLAILALRQEWEEEDRKRGVAK